MANKHKDYEENKKSTSSAQKTQQKHTAPETSSLDKNGLKTSAAPVGSKGFSANIGGQDYVFYSPTQHRAELKASGANVTPEFGKKEYDDLSYNPIDILLNAAGNDARYETVAETVASLPGTKKLPVEGNRYVQNSEKDVYDIGYSLQERQDSKEYQRQRDGLHNFEEVYSGYATDPLSESFYQQDREALFGPVNDSL